MQDGKQYFRDRLYIAEHDERLDILRKRHDSILAGHFGIAKTLDLIARDYWWPNLRLMVRDYVRSCDVCVRSKPSRRKPAGLLLPLSVASMPWTDISMDFIVKLPRSSHLDSILVVVDRFTKMAHFIPWKESLTSADLASLVFSHVVK